MSQEESRFHFPLEILNCPWSELHSYCVEQKVFWVDTSIDLLVLAKAVAQDDSSFVHGLVQEKKLWQAQPEEAEAETICSFVIVQPYIFVSVYS